MLRKMVHGLSRWKVQWSMSTVHKKGQKSIESQETFRRMMVKLESIVSYSSELESQALSEQIDYTKAIRSKDEIRRELSRLAPLLSVHDSIKDVLNDIQQVRKMTEENANDQYDISQFRYTPHQLRNQAIEFMLPKSAYDQINEVTMELKPGTGGMEASHFVQDVGTQCYKQVHNVIDRYTIQQIGQMYMNYCMGQGWSVSIIGANRETGGRGYKSLRIKVTGESVYKIMKCESGVHKVIRVPQTEAKGRLHSSTMAMVVMPTVPFTFQVNNKDIKYQFMRSSGPGGQAVNKIESACRAVHIPTNISVCIQEEKSQEANKKRATELLKQKLFELEYEKVIEAEHQNRQSQVTTMGRSDKIRTYNFPQDRITDHRTGVTLFGIKAMLNGDLLQKFIDAFNEKNNHDKITLLLDELYAQN